MKINRLVLLAVLTFVFSAPAFSGVAFIPTGVIEMIPTSMSDDGTIVVGTGIFGTPNLYYTEAGGATIIGDGCGSGVPAISGDGTTVVGCHVNSDGKYNAAKWLGSTSWLDLGTVEGGVSCDIFLSGSYGINHDGSLAVGLVYLQQICRASAGIWDLVNGGPATALPKLFNRPATRANAVNADGSVIVGWQDQLDGLRTAAKWVNHVEELITTDDGSLNGEAHAVSADGKTIVGGGYKLGDKAWIWREGAGVIPIGSASGFRDVSLIALDVTDNGKVAVGFASKGRNEKAFIWRKGGDAFYLNAWLENQGAVVPPGWELAVASLISADGNTIYGWGFNPDGRIEMFKIDLNAP